ncbi:hypothetical protein ACGFNU_17460 [Spirillospora sp. NPDC048911]|uniref:hypothetical protein n=1 Tax=Spirillospora sp. NPDC048911 TaxID=3364527 RepID=UPI00371B1E48
MAWMSADAARIAGRGFFQSIAQDDLISELQAPIDGGWMISDGATLLRAWRESYFGDRSRFSEVVDYEVAVNGRGIPDMDLDSVGEVRVLRLLRRGVAFAWAALNRQHCELPSIRMAAYVSVAPTLFDPAHFTGNVTFCTMGPGRPIYIDPERTGNEIVVALFTEDCEECVPKR